MVVSVKAKYILCKGTLRTPLCAAEIHEDSNGKCTEARENSGQEQQEFSVS